MFTTITITAIVTIGTNIDIYFDIDIYIDINIDNDIDSNINIDIDSDRDSYININISIYATIYVTILFSAGVGFPVDMPVMLTYFEGNELKPVLADYPDYDHLMNHVAVQLDSNEFQLYRTPVVLTLQGEFEVRA